MSLCVTAVQVLPIPFNTHRMISHDDVFQAIKAQNKTDTQSYFATDLSRRANVCMSQKWKKHYQIPQNHGCLPLL